MLIYYKAALSATKVNVPEYHSQYYH